MRNRAKHIAGALLIGTFTLYLGSGAARADVIDGEWCLGVNHFAIQGPDIVTPGGHQIKGNYWRHGFAYIVPADETDAGREIDMRLLNEETVELTRKGQTSSPETWHRCKPTS